MGKYNLFTVSILAILLLLPIVSAVYTTEIIPISNRITYDGVAVFKVIVHNNESFTETYNIKNPNYPVWDVYTKPRISPIEMIVAPNSSSDIEILVDPLQTLALGSYALNIDVKSKIKKELYRAPVKVAIVSTLISGYVPTIIPKIDIPSSIDPREEIPIEINLNNQNMLEFPDLVVKIESELFNDEIKTELGSKGVKILDLREKTNPLTAPGDYLVKFTLLKGDIALDIPVVDKVSVIEYADFSKDSAVKKEFFETIKELKFVTNNKNYKGRAKIETTLFRKLFTATEPRADSIKEGGKLYLVWDVALNEENIMDIKIVENYRLLFYIIFLLIIIIVLYSMYRSPLIIQKAATNIQKREGGISELKTILTLRNRVKQKITDITLIDTIPNIADIEKEITIGTLQPSKVMRHEKRGTIIKWLIDSLDANEERVITYKVRSRLPVLGGFSLPPAMARLRYKNRNWKTRSNRLEVNE